MKINSLKNFKKTLDTYIDVAFLVEPKTMELIYLNKRGRYLMHIDEERENRDREYQIVSSFIPVINKNLKPGVIETCNFLNPQSGVYCRIHQTLIDFEEGTYLFFTAQPLSEANNTNVMATNFLNDVLLLSTRFSDAKDQVDNFIEITRMEYEAEHVYVAELQTDGSMRIDMYPSN